MSEEYPLEQVLSVKRKRVTDAERVVEEKTRALEVEQEKLKKIQGERDEVQRHFQEKTDQLKAAFNEGTTAEDVLKMKGYIKVVEERKGKAEKKVAEQETQVQKAEEELEAAKEDLRVKRLEEEKITIHKEEWEKEIKQELDKQEAKEQDEVGQLLYESQKRKKK
ncbi:MAG: hypothetical protein S4CHLAM45_11750 [Chlamydiales bacterium]|nr:hypothetical protein [Chlamydiales bacterium]MCH9619667.1 hypothetical protein [Chlamydiales bacterium]MCH9623273.1 hypothetical protein [Chlamydiales bacterium]